MKKMSYFVMALALVLGLTQCKKEQVNAPENETKTVNITLKVGGNSGAKHDINTTTGAVDFQDDDVIYVGNGSTYIGTLTRTDGVFSGPINEPDNNTEIYFYFVGGLTPSATPEAGTTSSFTVDISNQSTQMPVLSCNHVTYYSGTSRYSCKLENKCALVKFTTASTTDPVHVGGLYTEAMIDFDNNSITNNGTTGFVNLHPDAEDNEAKWAVLLPQTGFEDAEAAIAHVGYTTTIPTIAADAFITGEDAVSISTQSNIVYLDWLTSNYTATDGQTLKGTLGANVKISIAAGATVTLNNATITGTNSNSYRWAGINCENNATIILEGTNNVTSFYENYPGIHIASGKTLTIQGSGTLNASSNGGVNGWGAGIGGSDLVDCGNIVINSGTINATGGIWMAGIGGGFNKNCGSITINGGNVTATGGRGAAGIGTGVSQESITCGDISITGGIVDATGGPGAAGIGSGFVTYDGTHNTCGNISITGGQVSATGGDGGNVYPDILNHDSWEDYTYYGGAGIGTGSSIFTYFEEGYSSCGTITIGSNVTSVTATKGGGTRPATNSIGKNHSSNSGTCGTVTIGGTEYPNGADANQADGLTFVYPYAAPAIPAGAINGLFSVSSTKQVYFSQGNLQATTTDNGSTWIWSFATNQYDYVGDAVANTAINGNGTVSTNGTVDLFGWSTAATVNGIHNSTSESENDYSGDFVDWGNNAIANGGNTANSGWRTLTKDEWVYLFNTRTDAASKKGLGKVNSVNGIILLPDEWTLPSGLTFTPFTPNSSWANDYTTEQWAQMEAGGAVFLPAAGNRQSTSLYLVGDRGYYWSSTANDSTTSYIMFFANRVVMPQTSADRYLGRCVRLVHDNN